MTSKLFGIYDPKHMDMCALDTLIQKWLRFRGKRTYTPLSDWSVMSTEDRINYQFGYGLYAVDERNAFDHFYDATRIKFFEDETKSTYRDALQELQPHMLDYMIANIGPYLRPKPAYVHPIFIEVDEEMLLQLSQNTVESSSLVEAEQERQRRSKRLCVLQKSFSAPESTSAKRKRTEDVVEPNNFENVLRKPKKSNFNSVQWKHLQVQARKQLHEAVLSFDFTFVRIIAAEWMKETDEERRLDIDALEWAFRRICKQLLPHAAEKEANMRQNGTKMIDTLFDCFRTMKLCSNFCMRQHIIAIAREVGNRNDIVTHMLNFRCSCCLTLEV